MTTLVFDPILTDAGQAAAFNASNDGIELQLTHVSFGTGHYDPLGTELELENEVSGKLPIAGGSRPTLTQIRMTSVWREAVGTFEIGEVGFWSDDILVFIWSKADGQVVGYKTPGVDFVLFNDLGFTQVPAGSINITIDPDASVALAALAAHEGADNAHPQYVRYDVFPAAQINLWAKVVAGTANALVITLQDGVYVDAYTDGLMIRFKASAQSTGPATVNIDGKGVVDIRKSGGDPLEPGDIRAGGIYELVYDGEFFQLAGGVGGSGFFEKFPHVAIEGQTDFAASYTPGNILVFQNGRELGESAYTATDGIEIVLNDGATAGDEVVIVAFSTFSVADTYTKAEVDALTPPDATEAVKGVLALSSVPEVLAGLVADKAVTPHGLNSALGVSAPSGFFSGFQLANNSVAPNTTIDVGAGCARSSDDTVSIKTTATIRGILQAAGAWTAGDNQNKLDTGVRANNTWYSVFAIRKTSDGTADILFSLSATAPTMPSGYAGFRRISSARTDASGNILGFINVGNRFVYKTPVIDMTTAPITVRAPYVMKVPTGVRVLAQIAIQGAGGDFSYWIAETDGGAIPSSMYYGVLTSIGDDRGGQAHYLMTNTSGQVLLETGASVTTFNVSALGWTEIRG